MYIVIIIFFFTRLLGTRRVRANQVYQDYISDRHHTHMNATQVSVIKVEYRKE